jgi:host factor-I protein
MQQEYLNQLRQQKTYVTVFLLGGVKLIGSILSFDQFSIILKHQCKTQLIYKHGISTIVPSEGFTYTFKCDKK